MTIQVPIGAWVSNDLPSAHCEVLSCQSRTETSSPGIPNTTSAALLWLTCLQRWPIASRTRLGFVIGRLRGERKLLNRNRKARRLQLPLW